MWAASYLCYINNTTLVLIGHRANSNKEVLPDHISRLNCYIFIYLSSKLRSPAAYLNMNGPSVSPNSPLDAWIDFSEFFAETASLPAIQNCTINGTTANCTYVCGHSHLLFDPFALNNLVTCGIWQTASAAIHFEIQPNNTENTAPFEDLGLSMVYDYPLNSMYQTAAGMISQCFSFTCDYKSPEDYAACYAYDLDALFGSGAIRGATQGALLNCMDMICNPHGSLNPDLGGVGVSALCVCNSYSC